MREAKDFLQADDVRVHLGKSHRQGSKTLGDERGWWIDPDAAEQANIVKERVEGQDCRHTVVSSACFAVVKTLLGRAPNFLAGHRRVSKLADPIPEDAGFRNIVERPMLVLVIGNKNYSSWSLRGWLALAVTKAPFEERLMPIYEGD